MQGEQDTSQLTVSDASALITRAFEEAYFSGKPDWRQMTTAVLKNRLLSLTDREFDESTYGAMSFMEFLTAYSEILHVDRSKFPPVVELQGDEWGFLSKEVVVKTGKPYRIRFDLWRAALDYSSGAKYGWDEDRNEARQLTGQESFPVIDTITAETQKGWRSQFLSENTRSMNLTESEVEQSDVWLQLHLQTHRLPAKLVPHWNRFFRDRVLAHLENWFTEANVTPPRDLVTSVRQPIAGDASGADELRHLVMSVVQKMTSEELSNLELPAQAVLRATRKPKT